MRENISYEEARELLLEHVTAVGICQVNLSESIGRVLAKDITAMENVPAFDRSPYDGYALRCEDTGDADEEHPAELKIIEEVPAGAVPTKKVVKGSAVKILTGAPIPDGADAVIKYEETEYSNAAVRIFHPLKHGSNIVHEGEDVRAGEVLAKRGERIDAGLAASLAAQGIGFPNVYCCPRIGLISTGDEVVEVTAPLTPGKIYNTNRYSIEAVLAKTGCITEYKGIAGDSREHIAGQISRALEECDALILTGGVSAGDYDLTPGAMELAGVTLLARRAEIKPGMACAYGVKDGKLVCGLSGNPVAAVANLQLIVLPALKRLCGLAEVYPHEITVTLSAPFLKKSKKVRPLYGKLELDDGIVKMRPPQEQGNAIISSLIGCDVMAVVPAGSRELEIGTRLKGFVI